MNRNRLNHLITAGFVALLLVGISAAGILTSASQPTDVSASYIPVEVGVPIRHNLGRWRQMTGEAHFRTWSRDDEIFLQVDRSLWNDPLTDPEIESWNVQSQTDSHYYEDFAAAVDVRIVDADWYASGCLTVRGDPSPDGHYSDLRSVWLCVSSGVSPGHELWTSWYDETGARSKGEWMFLDQQDAVTALNPLNEWNRLKIIAKGRLTWMFVNDQYAGFAYHLGPPSGAIGVRISVPRGGYGTFAFRNLTISRID